MKSARISIAGMLAAVSVFGVAFAALAHPNQWAASAFLTATFGLLLLSLFAAFWNRGIRRVFWTGFALFGWAYGLVNLNVGVGGWISQQLVTTQGLHRLQNILHPPPSIPTQTVTTWNSMGVWRVQVEPINVVGNAPNVDRFPPGGRVNWGWPAGHLTTCPTCGAVSTADWPGPFMRIGQSLATLLIGLIGGIAAVVVFRRACRHAQDATNCPIALKGPFRSP
jgi:hypothetical protein